MAKYANKGTVLQREISAVFTAVAQIISLDKDDMASETFESDTLDNPSAGIPYDPTGRTEGGSMSGELFLDPALAGHGRAAGLLGLLSSPPITTEKQEWKLIFADVGTTEWPFTGAGFSLGASIAIADGLKSSFSIKLDKIPVFP